MPLQARSTSGPRGRAAYRAPCAELRAASTRRTGRRGWGQWARQALGAPDGGWGRGTRRRGWGCPSPVACWRYGTRYHGRGTRRRGWGFPSPPSARAATPSSPRPRSAARPPPRACAVRPRPGRHCRDVGGRVGGWGMDPGEGCLVVCLRGGARV